MYLENEQRPRRSYDWSGARARRQRIVWFVIAACAVCTLAFALIAGGLIDLQADR